jgi:hypothetical protein
MCIFVCVSVCRVSVFECLYIFANKVTNHHGIWSLRKLTKYTIFFWTVYRFPNFSLPKSEWTSTLEVRCGWGKQWDPPTLLGCIDPRGCQPPPSKTKEIYGSYEVTDTKPLDVGTTYWYACRAGLFRLGPDNYSAYLELSCINDPNGGPPFWDPPYDHEINPFPICEVLRKYYTAFHNCEFISYLLKICILSSKKHHGICMVYRFSSRR